MAEAAKAPIFKLVQGRDYWRGCGKTHFGGAPPQRL